jgi:hypothetical protein
MSLDAGRIDSRHRNQAESADLAGTIRRRETTQPLAWEKRWSWAETVPQLKADSDQNAC